MVHDQLLPRVAYASQASAYMVVWEYTANTSDHDIYARQVGADGQPIGVEQALRYSSVDETVPAVTYNSAANEYLLVWEQEYSHPTTTSTLAVSV